MNRKTSRVDVVFMLSLAAILFVMYELGWATYVFKLAFLPMLACYEIGKWARDWELRRGQAPSKEAGRVEP